MQANALADSVVCGFGNLSPKVQLADSARRSTFSKTNSKSAFALRLSARLENSTVLGMRTRPGGRGAGSTFSPTPALSFNERLIELDRTHLSALPSCHNVSRSISSDMMVISLLYYVRTVLAQLQVFFRFSFFEHSQSQKLQATGDVPAMPAMMITGIIGTAFTDLSGNHVFMSAFWSWLTAQVMKYFTAFYREGRWDWRVMFDSGGMPSSHTSLVVGLTTGIAYQYGLGSTMFPLSLAFSLIVMYDAAGVRRHAGKQAEVLNKILDDMFHGESISERKLKEVLGHSPLQVLAGAVLGVFIGVLYMYKYSSGYGVGA